MNQHGLPKVTVGCFILLAEICSDRQQQGGWHKKMVAFVI
jgi:hypothetical protein